MNLKRFVRLFTKYALVGAFGTVLNTVILFALTQYFGMWYMFAYAVGVAVACVANFFLHALWTFRIKWNEK